MISSDKTFELIQSMSKSEKRYFKITGELFKSDNLALKVFDALEKMDQYSEVVFYANFGDGESKKKISSVKSQLFYTILKSLREFHYKKKKRFEVKNLIDFADILFEKGLFDQCRKLIEKAEKLADENDYIILLDELTILQNRLAYVEGNVSALEEQLLKQGTKYTKARVSNQRIGALEKLFTEIKLIWVKGYRTVTDSNRADLQRIINHDFLRTEFSRETVEEEYYYHLIRGYYFFLMGDGPTTLYHKREVLRLTAEEFYKVCDSPRIWLANAKSYLGALSLYGTLEEFENGSKEILEQLDELPFSISSESFVNNVQILIYESKLNLLFLKKEFEEAGKYAVENEDFVLSCMDNVEKNDEMIMCFNKFYAFFFNNDFKRALKWLNMLLNRQYGETRLDVQIYSNILNIYLHHELGNYSLVPHLHKRAVRFVKTHDRGNEYITLLLQIASQVLSGPVESEEQKEKLRPFLPLIEEQLKGPNGGRFLNYFDAHLYLEKKLS